MAYFQFHTSDYDIVHVKSLGGGGGGVVLALYSEWGCAAEMGDCFPKKIPKHGVWFCAGKSLNMPPPTLL